jgi:hypothetical protein
MNSATECAHAYAPRAMEDGSDFKGRGAEQVM